jgi:putative flavoprotein involved in K+ transport
MTGSTPDDVRLAETWVAAFGKALQDQDERGLAELFAEDSHWRDLLAVTWDMRQVSGRGPLVARLLDSSRKLEAHSFRLSEHYAAPTRQVRVGREVVEAFFEFDTVYGSALGLVRICDPESSGSVGRAWMLLTQIESVTGALSVRRGPRPAPVGTDGHGGAVTWAAHREWTREFADREPDVLIVGGGQGGVMLAAHLNRLGVDNLIIDSNARVGDNWRSRYESLQLHNQTHVVHFPYLPFPDVFPEFIPKDKLANWFEDYVDALEINFWTSTPFVSATRDDDGRWTVPVVRDGVERVLRPRHLVMTTGGTGVVPHIPDLPGLADFSGTVQHSKQFVSADGLEGKRVLVVGVGTSAHDIASTAVKHGAADVAMLQRGTVSVVSLESANSAFGQYASGLPLDVVDTISAMGWIGPVQTVALQAATVADQERDAALLAGLKKAGLRLDDGDEHTGWIRKFVSRGGGYYINVGASDLIIDGRIRIIQAGDVDTFDAQGLVLTDGVRQPFDLVVLATGFESQSALVRAQFGDEIADRVGPIGGYDEEMEVRNTWRPTAQPGLYFGSGSLQFCRTMTPLFAQWLRAEISGLAPSTPDAVTAR